MFYRPKIKAASLLAAGALLGSAVAGFAAIDYGQSVENALDVRAPELFGVVGPVAASSTASISQADALADPTRLVTLARSLKARMVTQTAAPVIDRKSTRLNSSH